MAARSCGASRSLLSVSIATRSAVVRSAVYGLTFVLLAETVHGRGEPHLEVLAYYPPLAATVYLYTATSSVWVSAPSAAVSDVRLLRPPSV